LEPLHSSDANALTQRSSTMPDDSQDTPVLDTIAAMTAVSVAECELPLDALLLVRLAALAAVDAPPASYLLHIGPAAEAGITIEDAQNVLVAVAPIIGTARVMSASINIAEALELAIAVIEEDLQ
jgi:alkylhydroperoxidase/carboxymuconolactone decarboxylase family protein YurZ